MNVIRQTTAKVFLTRLSQSTPVVPTTFSRVFLQSSPSNIAAVSNIRKFSTITTDDSHSDFGRVVKKVPTAEDVVTQIRDHISESKVVLYMKGLPSSPSCGFSWKTVQILNAMGVEYRAYDILIDEHLRQGIKQFSDWPTIPQLYVNGEFIGGCDIVEGMARSGELKKLLIETGALAETVNQEK